MYWHVTVCCLHAILITVDSSVIVTTTGPVLGKLVIERDLGVTYYAYQGIPYAENPGKSRRFKPPVPKTPWLTVRNATNPGPVCPQLEGRYKRDQMSEDCLTLNVYVPATRSKGVRAAYFYIHGGAFKSLSGNIEDSSGPQFLLKQDVIFISTNYRLGALGFLSSETDHAPGNAGIKDIILALKWVKNNIKRFGGGTLTIGGQSAGSAIVHYLLLSKQSNGLFQRAVLNSGSATNFRYLSMSPTTTALALAEELNIPTANITSVIENLTNVDVFDIVTAQDNIFKNNRNIMRPFGAFVPSVEKKSSHAVLTETPNKILQSGIRQNVPLLLGITSQEGAYMWRSLIRKPIGELQDKIDLCIPCDIQYPIDSQMHKDLVKSMSDVYFDGSDLKNWTLTNFYNLVSDTQYASSVDLWLRSHLQRIDRQPVYYYVFDFDGELNWAKVVYNISFPGAAHADDLGYMFVTKDTKPILDNINAKTKRALNNTSTFLGNFIKFGNPTPPGSNFMWHESGPLRNHVMVNDAPGNVLQGPFRKRFDFWQNVYHKYDSYVKSGGAISPKIC
ncbi:hypothetical protein ACJJTC_015348 [Scirpophaga incertulas]